MGLNVNLNIGTDGGSFDLDKLLSVLPRLVEMSEGTEPPSEESDVETILNREIDRGFDLRDVISEVASHYLLRALDDNGYNFQKAGRSLGLINQQTMTNWVRRHLPDIKNHRAEMKEMRRKILKVTKGKNK